MKYWEVRDWIFPKQRWLYKTIPNHWTDKCELTWICLSEMLVHFVEKEDGLESIWGEQYLNDDHISDEYRSIREPIRKELEQAYEYIKTDRAILQKELDAAYPTAINGGCMLDRIVPHLTEDGTEIHGWKMKSCEEMYGMSYEKAYAEVNRLEKLITDRDTECMMIIVKNREYLWT